MRPYFIHQKLLVFFTILIIFAGCKQPETIVVEDAPSVAAPSDTTIQQSSTNDASFRKLVIGEYNSISTLDPLFADNTAEMRAAQLVYEGLTRINSNGTVIPAMAKQWEISTDSLEYTFHLRPAIYYHDSEAFSTGTGRRMTADDVKFVFERMAKADVPPRAAHLFMDIKGFNSYFQEQHQVYNPEDRKLDGINGIQIPNDSTIVFQLTNKDPQFLQKMATPLAVVYPKEAVGKTVDSFSAVGTGPFAFSSQSADSTLIFSKYQDYYNASDVKLNRVDITAGKSESALFRAMGSGEIYLLPQLGPQLLQNVLNNDGHLKNAYRDRYDLQKTNGTAEYTLRFYPDANVTADQARSISKLASTDPAYFDKFPNNLVTATYRSSTNESSSLGTNLEEQFYSAFSEDPFIRTYLGSLSKAVKQYGGQLQMVQIRAPHRNTGLLFSTDYPLIPDSQWTSYKKLFSFDISQVALLRSEINGLRFNQYPWWLDVRNIDIPAVERLN
jgi:ABC-type transport system substrate-binding protein